MSESEDSLVGALLTALQVRPRIPTLEEVEAILPGFEEMKVSEIVISFFETLNAKYGDGTTQFDIDFRTTENYDSPPDLFTGDTDALPFDGGFTKDPTVVISGSDPFPCTVRAIILRTEKAGR